MNNEGLTLFCSKNRRLGIWLISDQSSNSSSKILPLILILSPHSKTAQHPTVFLNPNRKIVDIMNGMAGCYVQNALCWNLQQVPEIRAERGSVRLIRGFSDGWYPGGSKSYLKATWWKIYLLERSLTLSRTQWFNFVKDVPCAIIAAKPRYIKLQCNFIDISLKHIYLT